MAGSEFGTRAGDLHVLPEERRAYAGGVELELTARQFDILAALAERPGWVLSAEELSDAPRPEDYASPFAVDVHISRLRAKLRDAGAPDVIETVRGTGWRLRRSTQQGSAAVDDGEVGQFVGRTSELAALKRTLESGYSGFALVVGEPGIGKTSLVERYLSQASQSTRILHATCSEEVGNYWVWRQIVQKVEGASGCLIAEHAGGPMLARLFGALESGEAKHSFVEPSAVYESVRRYLEDALQPAQEPWLFFIDDLERADNASAGLLAYLLRRLPALPFGLVAACREHAAKEKPSLTPVLECAGAGRKGTLIRLQGLPQESIVLLASKSVGDERARNLGVRLTRLSGGNPLFLGELLRCLGEHDDCSELPRLAAPALIPLVKVQVEALPEQTRLLLAYVAVAGDHIDTVLLDRCAEEAGAESAQPAVEAGLLIVEPARVRFRHLLIREALLAGISDAQRQRLHGKIGDILRRGEGQSSGNVFSLAWHYSEAGTASRGLAVGYLISAARASSARFAFEDAIEYLERARSLVPSAQMPSSRSARVMSAIVERIGHAKWSLGDYVAARHYYEEALQSRPAEDTLAAVRMLTNIGRTYGYSRSRGSCASAFARALASLESVTERGIAWWRSWIEVSLARVEAASMCSMPTPFSDLSSELGEPVLNYGTDAQKCRYYLELASREAIDTSGSVTPLRLEAAEKSVEWAAAARDSNLQTQAAEVLGRTLITAGSFEDGESYLRHSLELAQSRADLIGEVCSRFFLAMGARLAGDVIQAETHATELARLAEVHRLLPEFESGPDAIMCWVALRRGNVDQAELRSARALKIWAEDPACSESVWMMAWPAVSCALLRNDVARAIECAALMIRSDQEAQRGNLVARLADLVETFHGRGDAEVLARLRELESEARSYNYA